VILAMQLNPKPASTLTCNLNYFCVETDWFRRAFPYLNSYRADPGPVPTNWKEGLGRINSSEQCEADDYFETGSHPDDFLLVGSNAWLLLSKKFGADRVVSCGVQRRDNGWCVMVSEQVQVPIPPTSRFPYEEYVGEAPDPQQQQLEMEEAEVDNDLVRFLYW